MSCNKSSVKSGRKTLVSIIVTVGPMESLLVIIHPVVSVLILHYQLPGVNIVT